MLNASFNLATPSSSTPFTCSSPTCRLLSGRPGMPVGTFCCRKSYAMRLTRPLLPGGWYFTPISVCFPVVGTNGLPVTPSKPDCGWNDLEYDT